VVQCNLSCNEQIEKGDDRVKIRKGTSADLDGIECIYNEIHSEEENGTVRTGWLRGVYPVRATAQSALQRDDLFVMEEDGQIYGAAIINQIQVYVYAKGNWRHTVPDDKVCVMHTLVISPKAGGRGLGRQFLQFYENYALENGMPELRIDTNETNARARALYCKLGYEEIGIEPTSFNGIPDVNLVLLEKYLETRQ
jgi:ribosomal protein S18 acetylase RimI-like enzyme